MQNRRDFIVNFSIGTAGLMLAPALAFGQADPWTTEYPKILARIKAPKFRKRDYSILKFGAKAGGQVDCRDAINKAIDACSKAGGGRVVVPAGEFLTGAIRLRSNVDLHISKGATLKFATDAKAYMPIVHTRWEGMELMHLSPLIFAYQETNIAITGEGTLDGQGKAFFWKWHGNPRYGGNPEVMSQRAARAKLYEFMDRNAPVEERIFGGEKDYLRPQFIQPYKCKNVLIEGVKIIDSPMWEVHPVLCENVIVRNLHIATHGPNNDGCDPESCKDVLIDNCFFDTGDDCIAIKSGRNNDGRRLNTPTENVIIRNCTMRDGHGGITVGSEISGGVRNVFAHDNKLDSPDLWTAIRFKNNASRGGKLENFYYKNNTIGTVSRAVIEIDFNYEEGAKGAHIPLVRNVRIDGLTCGTGNRAVDLQGLDNAPIYDVSLRNCTFGQMKNKNIVKNVKGIKLENVAIGGKKVDSLE
ncbi:MAG: glycoside hydrolase family 28 protein [Pyrinomonadaceae bacterium]|nr:glycoside hydrolase family 28 protein [Acidobacteriota bacterium]MBP7376078.1 glycoside hydrolase family 28 protein [Pyrinomonadaceae bacterium]